MVLYKDILNKLCVYQNKGKSSCWTKSMRSGLLYKFLTIGNLINDTISQIQENKIMTKDTVVYAFSLGNQ